MAASLLARVLLALALTALAPGAARQDSCSLCADHTRCIYQGLGRKCGRGSRGGPLTETEKRSILDTHNGLRALIAGGGEGRGSPGPQPPARDMQHLEWDEELAHTAQLWADQCDFGHDSCRTDPRFPAGQNVFLSEGGVPWEQAIISWYSEVEFFDSSLVDDFLFDEVTGHYSQMVWGNTRYVGCGKRTYPQRARPRRRTPSSPSPPSPPSLPSPPSSPSPPSPPLPPPPSALPVRVARRVDPRAGAGGNDLGGWHDAELQAYNRSIHEYLDKYGEQLHQSADYRRQLTAYLQYVEEARQLHVAGLDHERRRRLFEVLQRKYEDNRRIHERLLYHDRQLKVKAARRKKLNPFISKGYAFSTERPVIAGVEYEYYVCNYGPAGNYPGARVYSRGANPCAPSLCADPLTMAYYPGLEQANDPALLSLYGHL